MTLRHMGTNMVGRKDTETLGHGQAGHDSNKVYHCGGSTQYGLQWTVHSAHCTGYSLQYTVHSESNAQYNVQYTVHSTLPKVAQS